MINNQKKRISISKVQIGMQVADDVINNKGMLLIPKNTILNENHILKMKLYQIISLEVFINNIPEIDKSLENNRYTTNDLLFKKFEKSYFVKQSELEKHLNNIGNGSNVNYNALLSIANDLLKIIKSKNQLFSYIANLKSIHDYTYTHSLNVAMICHIFGKWLNYTTEEINDLMITGLLHDIGKLKININILNKPGKLTKDEFDEIKQHTMIGYNLIKDQPISYSIKMGVLMHHEKIDGSGYPLGLRDEQIHHFAKIITIVDIYDAMTSERSYHKSYSPFKVIKMFEEEAYSILDTNFLIIFLKNIAYNYVGSSVRLSTNEIGKIVFIHDSHPSRPIVEISNTMIDLMQEEKIEIKEIL